MRLTQLQSHAALDDSDLLPIADSIYNDGAITNITQENPVVITSNSHGLSSGDLVFLDGIVGQVELNGYRHPVTVLTGNTFSIPVDGTVHTPYISDGHWYKGSLERTTLGTLKDYSRWQPLYQFNPTPVTTSLIEVTNTSKVKVGLPIRYKIAGVNHYGVVDSFVEDASITVGGMAASDTIQELHIGSPELLVQFPIHIDGLYGENINPILLLWFMNTYQRWKNTKAYLVRYEFTHLESDDTGNASVCPTIDGTLVGDSLTLTTAGTWVVSGLVTSPEINYNEGIEIACTAIATSNGALHLSGNLLFVLE